MSSTPGGGCPSISRSGDGGALVAVSGASSPVGRAVVRVLAGAPPVVRRVLALDTGPQTRADVPPVPRDGRAAWADRVTCEGLDLASPGAAGALSGADVVVHLACSDDLEGVLSVPAASRRAAAVEAARAMLAAAAAAGVGRAVVVTSAMVFGARPGVPVPLADDAALAAVPDDGLAGDLWEVEQVASEAARRHPELTLASLRPAALVGEGVDTLVTRHFEAPRLLVVRDASTAWQFCHVEDVGSAIVTILAAGLEGPLTAGCAGWLTSDDVERLSGMRRLELPYALARATAERLQRVAVLTMPATDLEFVVHPWAVSSRRLLEAGWRPRYDNEACLRVLLEQVEGQRASPTTRLDRNERALDAAGAAVALVGTAAVWRQAKARQGRRRSGRG